MDDHSGPPAPMGLNSAWGERREYAVPTYTAPDDVAWYHFLHGNVPGHQIDFMYRPQVPQGSLGRVHFNHLATLMKYIEPPHHGEFAFAVGNLSRDDTQHEPGHGGLAIIFGFRLRGATDHAGRRDPPFAHGIAAVDRSMDYGSIRASSIGLFERLFACGGEGPSIALYREYVRCVRESPGLIEDALRAYTAGFANLPRPLPSSMSLRWVTNEAPQPKRIVIVHPDGAPFPMLAECAAKLAAVLYRSDIRWTAITSGRESDAPKGVMIRLVAQRDAAAFEQGGGPVMRIDEVPDDEATLARVLFGAQAIAVGGPERSWREELKSSGWSGAMDQAFAGHSHGPAAAVDQVLGGQLRAPTAAVDQVAGQLHAPPAVMPCVAPVAPVAQAAQAAQMAGTTHVMHAERAADQVAHARGRAAPERVKHARMDDEPTVPMMSLPTGNEGSAGLIEPPRDFERSARFSPAEGGAAMGSVEGGASRPREALAAPVLSNAGTPSSRPPPPTPGEGFAPAPPVAAGSIAKAGTGGVEGPSAMRRAPAPAGSNALEVPANSVAGEVYPKVGSVLPLELAQAKGTPSATETPDLDEDFRPRPKPRTAVWLALFAGATAATAMVYFMFFSPSPPKTDEQALPSLPAPTPSPTVTAAPQGGAPTSPEETSAPEPTAKPTPMNEGAARPPQPTSPGPKAGGGGPIFQRPKPVKPQPTPQPTKSPGGLWKDPTL